MKTCKSRRQREAADAKNLVLSGRLQSGGWQHVDIQRFAHCIENLDRVAKGSIFGTQLIDHCHKVALPKPKIREV